MNTAPRSKYAPGSLPLPKPQRETIARLVASHGEAATQAILGTNRATLARALAGLLIRPGTVALLQARLAKAEVAELAERDARQIAEGTP